MKTMYRMPEANTTIPMGVKSKNPKVGRPFSATMFVAKMLAGVPMRVNLPPNKEENESGRRSLETEIFFWREMLTTAGSNMAVAPTLFIKAEMMPQVSMMTAIRRISLSPARRKMKFPRDSRSEEHTSELQSRLH